MRIKNLFICLLLFCVSPDSESRVLSEVEFFHRCYAHITGKRVLRSHSALKQVREGSLSAMDACSGLLDKAQLNQNGRIANPNDREARAVLNVFSKLHHSFTDQRINFGANSVYRFVSRDIFDEMSPGLFFTKALFDPAYDVDQILKGSNDVEGIRTGGRPTDRGFVSTSTLESFTYREGREAKSWSPTFVQHGELIGVMPARTLNVPILTNHAQDGNNLLSSFGGGLLGTRSYTARSITRGNYNYDGADRMNRRWANNVLGDFLCKSLPAARIADGQPYKRVNADSSFRKSSACIQCHVTMDFLAAGGRNLRYTNISPVPGRISTPNFYYAYRVNQDRGPASVWPEKQDNQYSRRPPQGVLFFRSYDGSLVQRSFNDLDALGQAIVETDDYYACAAKKYYEHFTGVKVSLQDIHDPLNPHGLTDLDLKHRAKVIELGQELKETKDPMVIVKKILASSYYRDENFLLGLGE